MTIQYILGISAAAFVLLLVIELLRRRQLRERHAAWWLLLGAFALTISIYPPILDWLGQSLGFKAPINLVYFVSLIILFLVALQHSAELTKIEGQNQQLVEKVSLLEIRLKKLESGPKEGE